MFQKVSLVFLAFATLVPFYIKYKLLKQKYKQQLVFKQRHNCIVMYCASKGMSGWPPFKDRIRINISDDNCLDVLYEPIIYYINTASKSLDVAYMIICIQKIYDALILAVKRGIKVRMLMNFDHCKSNLSSIRQCQEEGIAVQMYISTKNNMESIMHYKYILKDYVDSDGYVLIGSMNLTRTAFLSNYEDIVFTSDPYLTKGIHDNFEKCWRDVEAENQTLLNKTTLLDYNLL